MSQDSEKLTSCIAACFYIFQQLRENTNLFESPPPNEAIEQWDWRMQNLSRALRFANGENTQFDVVLIKKIVGEFVKNSFAPDEQILLERELWDLCTRRAMLPLPKTQTENGKRVTALDFVRQNFAELNALIKHCSNKKQTLVEFARKHGFEFDGTHLLRTLNEVNLKKKRGANRGAK